MTEKIHYTIKDIQDAVRRFQVKVLPADITPIRQMGKLLEEAGEYLKDVGDRQKRVDAVGDMFYVLVGVANLECIDLEHLFNKIHASNMTKTGDGSLSPKGEGYQAPDIYAHKDCIFSYCPKCEPNGCINMKDP